MPGVVMDRNGADGAGAKDAPPNSLKRKRSNPEVKPLVNGVRPAGPDRMATQNGNVPDGAQPPPAADVKTEPADSSEPPSADAPLPLLQMEHITVGYQPLGRLIARLVQECHNDLVATIDEAADITVPPSQGSVTSNGVNGTTAMNGAGNVSEENLQKMRLWLNFANRHRERFIKALVLLQWSRRADDVSKLIDLFNYMRGQIEAHNGATEWIAHIKRELLHAMLPNPDMKTALQVLATGEADWMPSMGYIPKKPFKASEILATIERLNSILTIRLNTDAQLPQHFQSSRVHDGRVTFVIPEEFEVDFSLMSEEPDTPFLFIDIRFLFSPAPEVPEGPLRSQLEDMVNGVSQERGLSGCYEFLHQWVLTQKIFVLRNQAHEMARTSWRDCLKVEQVHRSLVVQYWSDSSRAKSWIELGIAKIEPERPSDWKDPPASRLFLRWFRNGKETQDVNKLLLDFNNLSMDQLLHQVISLHVGQILTSIQTNLRTGTEGKRALLTSLMTSVSEPSECVLNLRFGPSKELTSIAIEPTTGRLVITPVSAVSTRINDTIANLKELAGEAHSRIADLLCLKALDDVAKSASRCSWAQVRGLSVKVDQLEKAIKRKVLRFHIYCGNSWDPKWAIVAVASLAGLSWWIIEIGDSSKGNSIESAHQIQAFDMRGKRLPLSPLQLRKVEWLAVAMISFLVTSRWLKSKGVRHVLRRLPRAFDGPGGSKEYMNVPILLIQFASLFKSHTTKWTGPLLAIVHDGFDPQAETVSHIVKGNVLANSDLQTLITQRKDQGVAFRENGAFAILLQTPFGQPLAEQLMHRVNSLNQLRLFSDVLKKATFTCTQTSLSQITFNYASESSATIIFANTHSIRLEVPSTNPHHRIRSLLEQALNNKPQGIHQLAAALRATQTLMHAFTTLESAHLSTSPNVPLPVILARACDSYRLSYRSPPCTIDIRLRRRRDQTQWHVMTEANLKGLPEEFRKALKELFRQKGHAWLGLRTGIVAGLEGVEDALAKVDDIVRRFAGSEAQLQTAAQGEEQPQAQAQSHAHRQPQGQPHGQRQGQRQQPNHAPGQQAKMKQEPDIVVLD